MFSIQTPDTSLGLDDDRLVFADEAVAPDASEPSAVWKIMLVDDEPSVHQATKIALKFFTFEDKPLAFISAYSGAEAKELLSQQTDIAIVFLDVIMESRESGLEVAKYIRENLQNHAIRIILRTGQPGHVPEESVVINYDINDYKTKLELTQKKLFTTLVSGLRAYRDLLALAQSRAELAVVNHQLTMFNQTLEKRVRDRTQSLAHEVQSRAKAEEALKLYIHALTHDLRNPVTGMTNVLQSLLHQDMMGEPPTVQIPVSVLERMNDGCDRQLKMINSLLETRSIELRGIALKPQSFSLSEMLGNLLKTWEIRFERKRVQAVCQVDVDLPDVEGDRTQLWRVFENLIDNALKYNPPGITLTVTAQHKGGNLVYCSVRDNGVGIKGERADRLFDIYRRGSAHRATQGFGLGLYICRRIIEAHGSTIHIASPPTHQADGSGTQFWFELFLRLPDGLHLET